VVEHLADPLRFLEKASRLLRSGGHLFVLVPNARSLAMRWLGGRYRYVMAEHVNYFDARSLRRVLARAGDLDVCELRTSHFNPVVIWEDSRGGGKAVADSERVALLRRTTGWKTRGGPLVWGYRVAEGILSAFGLADNLLIVARRQ